MFRLNNLQKYTAALLLFLFLAEIIASPLSVYAQQSSGSGSSAGQTAVFATLGALAAGIATYCILQATGTIQGFGFGASSPPFQCTVTNPPGVHLLSADGLKKWIFDPAARIVIRALLQATTQQIVSWINGNGGKNVGYVANLEQALRQEADAAGGEFLNNLTGLNLCGNIGAFLNITLRTPGLRQRLECTVTDIIRNLDSFYQNFQQGGWPAFIRITLEPQNTAAGAYLFALDAKVEAENRARERVTEGYKAGGGFLGFRVPVKKNCYISQSAEQKEAASQVGNIYLRGEPLDKFVQSLGNLQFASPLLAQLNQGEFEGVEEAQRQAAQRELQRAAEEAAQRAEREQIRAAEETALRDEDRFLQREFCETEYETKTPGALIADGLSKATFGGLDFAWAAKEFDEAISVIINALIQKLISTAFVGSSGATSGQGIFDPGFRNLPREDLTESVIAKRINDGLFMADAAIALADTKLISDRKALFDARKKIDELTAQDPSGASADIQGQIQQLRQRISTLQASIAATFEIKKKILFSQYDLLLLEQSLASSVTPSEIQRVAQDLPAIILRLGNATSQLGALPNTAISTGSRKQDLLEKLRGTKNNLTNALTLVDDTGREIERVLAGNLENAKRQELTLSRTALLTQRQLLQSQLDSVTATEREILPTQNEDRIRDAAISFSRRLLIINQILEQTGDILTKIDTSLKL